MSKVPVYLEIDSDRLARRVLVFCIVAEVVFVFLDYQVNYAEWTDIGAMRRMFNTAREDGLASWFAITQTLLTGLTIGLIYLCVKNAGAARWRSTGWLVLTLFFLYMAVDDGAQLHERLGSTVKAMREGAGGSFDFFPSYTWQILLLPVFAALGLFMLGFLWHELNDKSSRILLVFAISLQVLAVGLDFVEGLDPEHRWNVYTILSERFDLHLWTAERFGETPYDALRHFSKSLEETIEMAAISILWFLFLRRLSRVGSDLRIRFVLHTSS